VTQTGCNKAIDGIGRREQIRYRRGCVIDGNSLVHKVTLEVVRYTGLMEYIPRVYARQTKERNQQQRLHQPVEHQVDSDMAAKTDLISSAISFLGRTQNTRHTNAGVRVRGSNGDRE
jgi:hypothetical protein